MPRARPPLDEIDPPDVTLAEPEPPARREPRRRTPPKPVDIADLTHEEWYARPRRDRIDRPRIVIDLRQVARLKRLPGASEHLAIDLGRLMELAINAGSIDALAEAANPAGQDEGRGGSGPA